MEWVKQKSPVPSPNRKRPSNGGGATLSGLGGATSSAMSAAAFSGGTNAAQELMSRCSVGIEGHNNKRTKV